MIGNDTFLNYGKAEDRDVKQFQCLDLPYSQHP